MNIFRAKHDNVPESPLRTLYGRKGSYLLLPLDVCILQTVNGREEFRPSSEVTRFIAAPIQSESDGRIGLIARYDWPPTHEATPINPLVMVQLAPSANMKGIEDLRVLASQVEIGDAIVCSLANAEGVVMKSIDWCTYPDLTHHVRAYRVVFSHRIARQTHGAAIHLKSGELIGMLIATPNQANGTCRTLVYTA